MFLSVSTNIYLHLPLSEALEYIANAGINAVEIGSPHLAKMKEEGKESFKIARKKGIRVYSVHGSKNISINPNFESMYKEMFEGEFQSAKKFGAKVYVTHLKCKLEEWEIYKDCAVYNCQLLADLAKEYDLIVGVETEWWGGGALRTPRHYKELIESAGKDNLRITLDGKHSATTGLCTSPENFVKQMSSYIVDYHSAEIDGPVMMGLGDWDIPGTGSGRLGKVITMLKQSGYKGAITIEVRTDILRKVLEVMVKVLSETGVGVEELQELLANGYSLEHKILQYSKKYLLNYV